MSCSCHHPTPSSSQVVFRLIQLWLGLAGEAEVNALLGKVLADIPSHKFLPLVYQLASRMSAGGV